MSESRVKLYKAVKRIGRGNFGVVSLVESLEDGKLYVNKTLALDQLSEQEKKGAHQEVLMLQALRKHPLIVRYKESIRDEENLHIIMEYCDGGDLASRIRNAKHHFTEKDILIWFAQIALAIQFCHRYNIIHRDIKSQNIFLTGKGIVKLGDFGVVCYNVVTYNRCVCSYWSCLWSIARTCFIARVLVCIGHMCEFVLLVSLSVQQTQRYMGDGTSLHNINITHLYETRYVHCACMSIKDETKMSIYETKMSVVLCYVCIVHYQQMCIDSRIRRQ
ncbi:hypothetical protein AAMO2058_000755900 [Amorphochlora amoebiformis]